MRFASRKDEFLPRAFYNIKADLPEPPRPPLHPGTKETLRPEDLEAIFPKSFIRQEGETAREVPIPGPVLEAFSTFRPTPLVEATALRKALDTPARIFYKYEGAGPVGSHKTNTALMQAYLARRGRSEDLGHRDRGRPWGSALAYAGSRFGIETRIFMVRRVSARNRGGASYGDVRRQRPREPQSDHRRGPAVLRKGSDHPGSLGIAISEAVEYRKDPRLNIPSVRSWTASSCTRRSSASKPKNRWKSWAPSRYVIGCVGGGSNFAGLAFPFVRHT